MADRWLSSRCARSGLVVLCLAVSGFLGLAALARADGLDDSVSRVHQLLRENEIEEAKLWIAELADIDDERVGGLLRELYSHDDDGIAILACRTLAKRADKRFLASLNRRAKDENFASERPALFRATIAALGAYASPTSCGVLESVIDRNFDTSPRIAILAIEAYARIEERDVVDHLIRWLARAAAIILQRQSSDLPGKGLGAGSRSGTGSSGASGGPSGPDDAAAGNADPTPRVRIGELRRVLLDELRRITGENHPDAASWRDWWKKHRAAFRF